MKVSSSTQVAPPNNEGGLKAPKSDEQIKHLAEEFESIFLEIVFKSMRETVAKSGLIDGGNAEDIYRSMLDTEYAKNLAQQHSTGLADSIETQLRGQFSTISDASRKMEQHKAQAAYQTKPLPILPQKL